MHKYMVEINGQNFLVDMSGTVAKYGFFTYRFVETADSAAAELDAVERIRLMQSLRDLVRNPADDPPVIDVTSITELASFDEIEDLEPGLIWYDERPKRWWHFWKR